MLLTKKFKTLVIVLIVLSVIILPTAFCVSYAKWTGGADSINASVNVGTWETKKFYLKFTSGSQAGTTIELTPDTQGDNPTCTGEFAPAVGDTFQLYYNGAALKGVAPKKSNAANVQLVVLSETDDTIYEVKNNGTGKLGLSTDGSAVSFYAQLDEGKIDEFLLGVLEQGTGQDPSQIRGVATSSGTALIISDQPLSEEWINGTPVYLEEGEQFKIYIKGNAVNLNGVFRTLTSKIELDKSSGIFTVKQSGWYAITAGNQGYIIKDGSAPAA